MINKKTFKKDFAAPFEKAGFVKRGQSWYLSGPDAVVVVNLQKSDFSDDYFVNFGIWLNALGTNPFPPDNHCHIQLRAEGLFPEYREVILLGCSLRDGDDAALAELSEFLEKKLVPFCRECTNENRIRALFHEGLLNRELVFQEARAYLSRE